jgi:hypothetical protein
MDMAAIEGVKSEQRDGLKRADRLIRSSLAETERRSRRIKPLALAAHCPRHQIFGPL